MKTTCKKISILFTLATAWLLLNSGVAQAQQLKQMDVTQIRGNIEVIPDQKKVIGSIAVHFSVLQDTDSLYLDAIQMKIREDRSKDVAVLTSAKKIWLTGDFKAGQRYTADFTYEAFPKKTLYFTGDQFWTQGQGKYTSHWLPSLDDMNYKIEFDLHYIAPGRRPVVANGKRFSIEPLENETVWSYDMQQPMSSYLVAFASGDFDKLELSSASGVPLELYFRTEDASKAEPTYRYTREIFDFLE
ncbi:MAG: M1 family peptidase, partial [Bacteroidota bacterium]